MMPVEAQRKPPQPSRYKDPIKRHSLTMTMLSDITSSKKGSVSSPIINRVAIEDLLTNSPVVSHRHSMSGDTVSIRDRFPSSVKPFSYTPKRNLSYTKMAYSPTSVSSGSSDFILQDVLQMNTGRNVEKTSNNNIVAESLDISSDITYSKDNSVIISDSIPLRENVSRQCIDKSQAQEDIDAPEKLLGVENQGTYGDIDDDLVEVSDAEVTIKQNIFEHLHTSNREESTVELESIETTLSDSSEYFESSYLAIDNSSECIQQHSQIKSITSKHAEDGTREVHHSVSDKRSTCNEDIIIPEYLPDANQINEQTVESDILTPEPSPHTNNLNREKPNRSKPKLSFLNKLKRSFKSCSPDKYKTTIPQLKRPPSTYMLNGSEPSVNGGSIHGSTPIPLRSPEKPDTPVLELLRKNPNMCSKGSLDKLNARTGRTPNTREDIRTVLSDPYLNVRSCDRSRSKRRNDKSKKRSRSVTKLIGTIVQRAKSLTEVTDMPVDRETTHSRGKSPTDAAYINDHQLRKGHVNISNPELVDDEIISDEKPKKRLSLVGRLKRKLSFGKIDKHAVVKREISQSVPTLNINSGVPCSSKSLDGLHRAKSAGNLSSSGSSTTDYRTQIVVKSNAKINKGCRCQVCTLVRHKIKSYCGAEPQNKHKYEVVLKMNLLGADFLNSECTSLASYQGNEIPSLVDDVIEGCIAAEVQSITSDTTPYSSVKNVTEIKTKTGSQIEEIVADFIAETNSTTSFSSHDTHDNLSGITGVFRSPNLESRQSTV